MYHLVIIRIKFIGQKFSSLIQYPRDFIRVIRVGKFAASKVSSAHMRSNNQYLLETLPLK